MSLPSPYKVSCLQVSHLYTSVEIILTNSKLLKLFLYLNLKLHVRIAESRQKCCCAQPLKVPIHIRKKGGHCLICMGDSQLIDEIGEKKGLGILNFKRILQFKKQTKKNLLDLCNEIKKNTYLPLYSLPFQQQCCRWCPLVSLYFWLLQIACVHCSQSGASVVTCLILDITAYEQFTS